MQPSNQNASSSPVVTTFPLRLLIAAGIVIASAFGVHAAPAIEIAYSNVFTNGAASGYVPYSALVMNDTGVLFGTTTKGGVTNATTQVGCGTLFKINPDGTGFQVLRNFLGYPTDGAELVGAQQANAGCSGGIIIGRDQRIYGTTFSGGSNNVGTIYSIRQDGTDYRVLHHTEPGGIQPTAAPTQASDGALYGVGSSLIGLYKMNTDGTGYQVLHQFSALVFSSPIEGLDGALYGQGLEGIYRIDKDGNNFTNLHVFNSSVDGGIPVAMLLQATNGTLYSTCRGGGGPGRGTIYKMNPDGTGFTVLHTFGDGSIANDVGAPCSGLVFGPGGFLYGTASGGVGGTFGAGAIYQIAPDGTGYNQICLFDNTVGVGDAQQPHGALCLGSSASGTAGILFGTAIYGGANLQGALYAVVVNPPASITPLAGTNQTAVFWPSWARGFRLQSSSTVNGIYTDVTNGTPVIGVQLPTGSSNQFFRLISP